MIESGDLDGFRDEDASANGSRPRVWVNAASVRAVRDKRHDGRSTRSGDSGQPPPPEPSPDADLAVQVAVLRRENELVRADRDRLREALTLATLANEEWAGAMSERSDADAHLAAAIESYRAAWDKATAAYRLQSEALREFGLPANPAGD
jgi:hypothetical protein